MIVEMKGIERLMKKHDKVRDFVTNDKEGHAIHEIASN